MIIVALGLIMDRPFERPYYQSRMETRPRRALALRSVQLERGWATLHRKSYRVVHRHRRSDRAPQPPSFYSPLRAA